MFIQKQLKHKSVEKSLFYLRLFFQDCLENKISLN